MSRSAFDAHTDPLFKNVGIPSLESIYKPQIGKFIYQYKSGLFPNSFNNMFLVTCQVHSYGTRSSQLFYLQQCRTTIRKFSVSFQGSKIFNSLIALKFEMQQVQYLFLCCKLTYIHLFFSLPLLFIFFSQCIFPFALFSLTMINTII